MQENLQGTLNNFRDLYSIRNVWPLKKIKNF